MASRPRIQWRTNRDFPNIPRYRRHRNGEQENPNFMCSQPDRRNGMYPGRVFYSSSRSNFNVGNCKDGSINNNNNTEQEDAAKAVENKALFKELPMCIDDDDEDQNTLPIIGNHEQRSISMDSEESKNCWLPTLGLECSDLNLHRGYTRIRNAQTMYNNSPRASSSLPHTVTSGVLPEEWANAPEFIPQCSNSVAASVEECSANGATSVASTAHQSADYGDVCHVCGGCCNDFRRLMNRRLCQQLQDKGEITGSVLERSKDKTCGICFENIMEKPIRERRFGILTMCNHCFCLACIRKWRQARNFENKVVKSCPECRITSDFVCPSIYWVDTKEEKDVLIERYKTALSEKHCKYFKQGRGVCPFGNKCFYLHALPDGTKTDVGPPPRRRRAQFRPPEDLDLSDMLQVSFFGDLSDDESDAETMIALMVLAALE